MTYKQLQTELKEMRAKGVDIRVKLNGKRAVLEAEYDRVIGQPKRERDEYDRMPRKELQAKLKHLKALLLLDRDFSVGQKTEILRSKLRTVLNGRDYQAWVDEEREKNRKAAEHARQHWKETYQRQEEERKRDWEYQRRRWEEAERLIQNYRDSLTKSTLTPETAYEKALQRGYSASEAASIRTLMETGSDRAKQGIIDRLAA